MKIGIYHLGAGHKDAGGKAVYNRNIALALSERHEVTLFTKGPVHEHLKRSGVRTVSLENWFGYDIHRRLRGARPERLNSVLSILGYRMQGDPTMAELDVLITHKWYDDLVLSHVSQVPTVYQIHGYLGNGLGGKLRARVSSTPHCIANSAATKRQIELETSQSVEGIVRPGVDLSEFRPTVAPAFESSNPIISFIGRLAPVKGLDTLLRAYPALANDAELKIVGDGPWREELERVAKEVGVRAEVSFEGVVQHKNLPGYYTASDIVCHPSRYEGFGMTNLEALASGSALVTTPFGIASEIPEEDSHVTVQPNRPDQLANALDRLLKDPQKRRAVGETARSVAENHSWKSRAKKMELVLQRLLHSERNPVGDDSVAEPSRKAPNHLR